MSGLLHRHMCITRVLRQKYSGGNDHRSEKLIRFKRIVKRCKLSENNNHPSIINQDTTIATVVNNRLIVSDQVEQIAFA